MPQAGLVFFVFSTGRCGTQKLTQWLRASSPPATRVEHEPLQWRYCSKLAIDDTRRPDLLHRLSAISRHFDAIGSHIERGHDYIETGWPAFGWLPEIAHRFGDRFRAVHLVRNPATFAPSLVGHRFFQPALRNDGYVRFAQLDPWCTGVRHPQFQPRWDRMSPFQRAIYHWMEINAFIEDRLPAVPRESRLMLLYESLFDPRQLSLAKLCDFLGLTCTDEQRRDFYASRVDQWPSKTALSLDAELAALDADLIRAAAQYGYDIRPGLHTAIPA